MILMNDFKAEPVALKEEMLAAVSRVIDSGWYVLGKEVESFEHAWAKTCGTSHAVGVGNGMDAIEIALRALDIGPGDEVITTPVTAFATVLAILRAGATPVLVDIESETALLDLESVSRCVSPKTKAVILVHLYGQVRDMDKWSSFCNERDLSLIEDCAQSHLASWKGRVAGGFGKVGSYSFYPTKNLGALGDAGALVTNDSKIAERVSRLRNYGQSVRYHHPEIGMNSRLDEVHSAMLKVRMKWLVEFTERRQAIAKAYLKEISNVAVALMAEPQEAASHVYHLFVVRCDERDALQAHLMAAGVQTHCHYPVPVHQQESCRNVRTDPNGLAVSEKFAQTCLSLPCHPQLTDTDVETVISAVNSFKGHP
jgi:dTDP-4-amino-4,6-dideoxygalactose transaminase